MDPIDSGPGQDESSALTYSSRGRQCRKNSKYCDYETDVSSDLQISGQNPPKTEAAGGGAAKKSPVKRGKAESDEKREATDESSEEETPKKSPRAKKTPPKRKTPAKRTPAKKTPAETTPVSDGAGGVADAAQPENGTPKPKRRYVRKQPPKEPVEEPVEEQEPEEETTPSGRHRRSAAKVALKYLHILANEVLNCPGDDLGPPPTGKTQSLKGRNGCKSQKRKRCDSDAAEDEDFIPDVEADEDEEEGEEEGTEDEEVEEDSDSGSDRPTPHHSHKTPNGLTSNMMQTVWDAMNTVKQFRVEHYSSWVFPEWVVSTEVWHLVPPSDLETYLPQELQSAAFRVNRDGLGKEKTPLERLGRFSAKPAHPDRWDMLLCAGGPVWAMEWCPTPDGAEASQYVALACHRGMEDKHCVNKTHGGVGLIQLWHLSTLKYNSRPDSQPALAYGLAQDSGFVWTLKWCPAGGWELPSCDRKAPFLPRLGLLAVATSNSVVTIYSLPHPDALNHSTGLTGKAGEQLPIYKAEGVLTLKLGSLKAPRHEKSGRVLSMDWLPEKPHNIMAVGFYDGVVGLWDLTTKSALLRLQEPGSLTLLPYRCLLAHDHAVLALAFCPASRFLLVTAGEDRYVKTWDLRRLYEPITVQKRYLTNEIYWPLNAPGILLAQENAYAPYGSQGVHYFDHHLRAIFAIPRTSTVWSISYTEWLNSVVTADGLGEVILSLLPQIGVIPQYIKRTLDRRFPVYLTSLVPHEASEEDDGGPEEEENVEGDAVEEQEGGEEENGGGGGGKNKCPPLKFQTYEEAAKRNWLQHTDNDMRSFARSEKRAVWKRMRDTELKTKLNMDERPLAALHKVRFNPNMCCHTWLASGGQTGLVRIHCLRAMIGSQSKKIIGETRSQVRGQEAGEEL
ncbi:general transcription factor 3C polypeptide 2 isoform X2 [Pseudoliparis swirei]|uniref:general transcription factor 3C polypeptide 2 isoform X2 n=1 Tax=Pseudoliparis swirei TaxID=2059687 RepID=UPI0024BDF5E6|nr:general transcription factor 3C polypeptide 2 isoform X2 [Pseudoliparis swirei]